MPVQCSSDCDKEMKHAGQQRVVYDNQCSKDCDKEGNPQVSRVGTKGCARQPVRENARELTEYKRRSERSVADTINTCVPSHHLWTSSHYPISKSSSVLQTRWATSKRVSASSNSEFVEGRGSKGGKVLSSR